METSKHVFHMVWHGWVQMGKLCKVLEDAQVFYFFHVALFTTCTDGGLASLAAATM